MNKTVVEDLIIYPIKGCRGYSVDEIRINNMGLEGDREFAVLLDGKAVNQKSLAALYKVNARYEGEHLMRLSAVDKTDFVLYLKGDLKGETNIDITLLGMETSGLDMGDEVAVWLSDVLSQEVRLGRVSTPVTLQIPLADFEAINGFEQSKFVDVAPILLTNKNSLVDLNNRLEIALPMNRFRANIVVADMEAYEEDQLAEFAFDRLTLKRVTVCERCIVTTIDQDSGQNAKEPLLTLSKYRKRKNHYAGGIMFGIYLIAETNGSLRIGDELQA